MEQKERVLKEIGKVLVNFGNLTFASLILGGIIRGDYNRLTLFFVGTGLVLVLVILGIFLLTKGEEV